MSHEDNDFKVSFFFGEHEMSIEDFSKDLKGFVAYTIAFAHSTKCRDKAAALELLDHMAEQILRRARGPRQRPRPSASSVCLGELILNLDRMVDAEWVTRVSRDSGASRRSLQVTLAAPTPAAIGASDWGTKPRTVVVPEGKTADALWALMMSRCDPPVPIGDLPGRTVSQ